MCYVTYLHMKLVIVYFLYIGVYILYNYLNVKEHSNGQGFIIK